MNNALELKTFWLRIETLLSKTPIDRLRDVMRGLASDIPQEDRQAFLNRFLPATQAAPSLKSVIQADSLLDDIQKILEKLKATASNNIDASWGYYTDENLIGPFDAYIAPLSELLERTNAVFDEGDFRLALEAYQALFRMEEYRNQRGHCVELSVLRPGIGFVLASVERYLRALYEQVPESERVEALFAEFERTQRTLYFFIPRLEAVEASHSEPLSGRETFLTAWTAFLEPLETPHAERWFREAVRLQKGEEGLISLARSAGNQRPRAWLDWGAIRLEKRDFIGVFAVSKEALSSLAPRLPIRAAVAEQLAVAAQHLEDWETLRMARWEAFASKPNFDRLLELWDATAPDKRAETMAASARHLIDYETEHSGAARTAWMESGDGLEVPASVSMQLLVHAWLLADRWDEATALVQPDTGIFGASDGQTLALAYTLMRLSGHMPDALTSNLSRLWRDGRGYAPDWRTSRMTEEERTLRGNRAYSKQLASIRRDEQFVAAAIPWCLKECRDSIDDVVGITRRSRYGWAALLTGAVCEALGGLGRVNEAMAFYREIKGAYPRHSVFQTELSHAISATGMSLEVRRR